MISAAAAIRLVAADVDGTLTNSASLVSHGNLAAIRRVGEKGVYFTIATGRGRVAASKLLTALDIRGPVILFGGAMIYDTVTRNNLYLHSMEWPLVRDVLVYARELGLHAQIYVDDLVIFEKESDFSKRYTDFASLPYRIDPQLTSRTYDGIPKVLVYAQPQEEEAMREKFTSAFYGRAGVSRSQPGYIEVNAIDATKGTALAYLAKYMGIRREEVAAIGDSYLDIDMIQWAGTGVCVLNGVPEALAAARIVVPSCEDDGVGYYLNQYIMK